MEIKNILCTGTNVLVSWEEEEKRSIEIPDELKFMLEQQKNGITQVLSVGPDCKTAKPGLYCLLGQAGKLLKIEGKSYGLIKEHMIDLCFTQKPGQASSELEGEKIKTKKTMKEVVKFHEKHKFKEDIERIIKQGSEPF